jgi:alanine racemase
LTPRLPDSPPGDAAGKSTPVGKFTLAGRPTAAFIDLDTLGENFSKYAGSLGPGRELVGVVKAEAYGHGARETAAAFVRAGAGWLAVATVEEGEDLRRTAGDGPAAGGGPAVEGLPGEVRILVMSGASPRLAPRVVAADLDAVIWDAAQAEALSAAATSVSRTARVHLKVDSGMRRLGIPPGEAADFLRRAGAMPGLEVTGLMSHLARADEDDGGPPTRAQFEVVQSLTEELKAAGLLPPIVHTANSAGGLNFPDAPGGLSRAGIALYGCPPPQAPDIGLRPAMTLKSGLIQVKEVAAGEAIGYGGTYRRSAPGRIAIVPIGYADGYPRLLSNRADALVRGKRVPLAGRVSMDMIALDVTDAGDVAAGDEAVLIGGQGEGRITFEELAARTQTISYEIMSGVGVRVPRVFCREGRVVGVRALGGAGS